MTTNFNITVITLLIIVTLGGLAALGFFLQKRGVSPTADTGNKVAAWHTALFRAVISPLILILIADATYFLSALLTTYFPKLQTGAMLVDVLAKLTNVILVLALFWFVLRLTNFLTEQFYCWATAQGSHFGAVISPLINNSLTVIATLILVNILLPYLAIPATYLPVVEKAATLLLITAISWIIVQLINACEQYYSKRYGMQITDNLRSRKIFTQITVLKKLVIGIVITVALAIALMTFDRVRELGTTLLASAGLFAAIGAFAAQKTLASTFAGLQIALTQPIKINDAVIVENEFGTVEEINLNYVVIKLWDWRRLVVPINYFIEKPFQNWTRNSSDLIGVSMLYLDYSVPVTELRNYFYEILANSALWDNNVKALQVTDAKENTLEIRMLASARNAAAAFDLRCEVREKMIAFIREHYPHCLPRLRFSGDSLINSAPPT